MIGVRTDMLLGSAAIWCLLGAGWCVWKVAAWIVATSKSIW